MRRRYNNYASAVSRLKNLPVLFFRLILAYGFYQPAISKWQNLEGTIQGFTSMNMPVPAVSVFLTAATELLGVILLTLGLGTRIIAFPLMIVMLVAIFGVHLSNGFAAANNGFEIPLYYFLMLFALMVYGSGKISIDYLISKK